MPERLTDRIALVMRGGSAAEGIGNGRARALKCARESAAVFVVDRKKDAAEQTARLIRDEGGASALGVGDVSIDDDVDRVVSECMAAFGRIDILHNDVARNDVGDAIAVRHAAEGIRADTILPGFIDTPHVHAFLRDHLGGGDTEASIRKRGSRTPVGRMGTAWDVANAAAFLVSDEADCITGTKLVVDAGVTATAVS